MNWDEFEAAYNEALEQNPLAYTHLERLRHSLNQEIEDDRLRLQKQQPTGPIREMPKSQKEQIFKNAINHGIQKAIKESNIQEAKEAKENLLKHNKENAKEIVEITTETKNIIVQGKEEKELAEQAKLKNDKQMDQLIPDHLGEARSEDNREHLVNTQELENGLEKNETSPKPELGQSALINYQNRLMNKYGQNKEDLFADKKKEKDRDIDRG